MALESALVLALESALVLVLRVVPQVYLDPICWMVFGLAFPMESRPVDVSVDSPGLVLVLELALALVLESALVLVLEWALALVDHVVPQVYLDPICQKVIHLAHRYRMLEIHWGIQLGS